jgi:hypothetical protein
MCGLRIETDKPTAKSQAVAPFAKDSVLVTQNLSHTMDLIAWLELLSRMEPEIKVFSIV